MMIHPIIVAVIVIIHFRVQEINHCLCVWFGMDDCIRTHDIIVECIATRRFIILVILGLGQDVIHTIP